MVCFGTRFLKAVFRKFYLVHSWILWPNHNDLNWVDSTIAVQILEYFMYLTHFMALLSFYTPWKHKKPFSFLMFSGGIERYQWHEMG